MMPAARSTTPATSPHLHPSGGDHFLMEGDRARYPGVQIAERIEVRPEEKRSLAADWLPLVRHRLDADDMGPAQFPGGVLLAKVQRESQRRRERIMERIRDEVVTGEIFEM